MKTILIKELAWGENVFKGDFIKTAPTSCGVTRMDRPGQLEAFKNSVDQFLEVVIDRAQPYFKVFSIPAWDKAIKKSEEGKFNWLRSHNTTV